MEQPPKQENNRKAEQSFQNKPSKEESNKKANVVDKTVISSKTSQVQAKEKLGKNNLSSPKEDKERVNNDLKGQSKSGELPTKNHSATASGVSPPDAPAQPVADMVEMGGGLPALPPRPVAPVRQAMPSTSASGLNNAFLPQRVPNLKQASKPQFNIPPGSDLGAVGKIGVYQMSHKSSAADIHANLYFWVYVFTFITTFVLIKRK